MPSALRGARPALLGLWLLSLAAAAALLHRPAPLFVNLGAGDEPFARGFRSRWEREGGRRGNPETMFRWTEDGARLELPFAVRGDDVRARLRLARFDPAPAEITLLANGKEVDRWAQPSFGFRVREVRIGPVRGPLALQFRSTSASGDALGVALDWAELHGAAPRPSPGQVALALGVLLGAPLLAGLAARRAEVALGMGALTAAAVAAAAATDPLGAWVLLGSAALPVLLASGVLLAALALLLRAWPEMVERAAVVVPLLGVSAWLGLVLHPFYYYPDVDRHAVLLHALQGDPTLLLDVAQPWPQQVTREIAGRKVALPYAFVFHALAWPLVPLLGAAAALKTAGVAALGLTLLLAFPLARAAGLSVRGALLAQLLAALLPVSTSRVVLALYPTLLGQAAIVLLLVHLARRFGHLDGARDAAAATAFFAVSQAVYTGSLVTVPAFVAAFAAAELLGGERRRVLRLLAAWGVATAAVALQYAGFVPVVWRDVVPHLGAGGPAPDEGTSPLVRAAVRLGIFYDLVFPLLVAAGLLALRTAAPHARRVIGAALAAGVAITALRYVVPAVLADAKDVELLLVPVAVAAAAGLASLWARGGAWRSAAAVAALFGTAWAVARSAALYAERFVSIGR